MAFVIDGTTGIATVDGSVSAPSQRGQDSNSGISYAADTIKFSTNGVERMAITNSGVTGTGIGAGKILKVTYSRLTSQTSVSGNGFNVLPNFTGTIQTSTDSSKVLVRVSMNLCGNGSYYTVSGKLYRGGSELTDATSPANGNRPGTFFTVGAQQWDNYSRYQVTSEYLDTPGNAGTYNYTIALSDQRDAGTIYVNRSYYDTNNAYVPVGMCSITCMEVAA